MGVGMNFMTYLHQQGALQPGYRVFDVGVQNLYNANHLRVIELVRQFRDDIPEAELHRFAMHIEEDGARLPNGAGFKNDAFLRELIKLIGCEYTGLDLFDAPDSLAADLNTWQVPPDKREAYDLVLNFGTSEHVLNQYNVLKVCHNLTAQHGWLLHSVPMVALEHGYYNYSPMLFTQLAQHNGYRVVDFFVTTAGTHTPLSKLLKHDLDLHPRDRGGPISIVDLDETTVPDLFCHTLWQKMELLPFTQPYDLSTSIADPSVTLKFKNGVAKGAGAARDVAGVASHAIGKALTGNTAISLAQKVPSPLRKRLGDIGLRRLYYALKQRG